MSDKFLIILLQIIGGNGNIDILLKEGLEYSQIALLISTSKTEGYIEDNSGRLVLTFKGKEKLVELNFKYNRTNSGRWISHLEHYKIDKIDRFDIYLPKKSIELR